MAYYFHRLAGFICPLLPARFGYWLFARIGDLVFLLTARKQPTYFYNLRRVLGDQATAAHQNAIARKAFQNLLKNYFDLFRWHKITKEKIREQLGALHGFEHLESAIKQGKGVIAGSGHFGAWDLVINLAAAYLDTPIVVPAERIKPEKLFEYVLALRRSQGIEMVPLDIAPRALIKALRDKQMVGLAYDRDLTQTGPLVNFFGAPTQMPDGAVQLALKYGSPVIIGFSVRQPDNRSVVFIEPPLEFARSGDRQHDIQDGVQQIAAVLEKYIRQYPDQWLMFQKIW
ncbi:MAG: lysophospholipid acyltransferase family protein [Chloroflexota bacterium]|nr:lysophospholipid acyltransferase family protein [Chloroflexota bacterium]